MKTLLVYYSFTGNNRLLAEYLQHKLGADLYQIKELKTRSGFSIFMDLLFKRTPAVEKPNIRWAQHNQIIFLAPIWAGKVATPLRAFLQNEKNNISTYYFIALCGSDKNKYITEELTKILQSKPVGILELAVNHVLPPEKKDKIKYTSGHKIQKTELQVFDPELEKFLQTNQLMKGQLME